MIAKGIETGDMELVKAGHAMLEAEAKKKKPATKKAVKKKATKKKAAPKKKTTQKTLTKGRKPPILTDDPDAQFRMQLRNPTNSRVREDGKMLMRTEPVDLTKIGKTNSFADDGKVAPRLARDKKLYVADPVPRRPANNLINATCDGCGYTRMVSTRYLVGGRYKCDKCLIKQGRTRG